MVKPLEPCDPSLSVVIKVAAGLKDLSLKVNTTIQLVFASRKIEQEADPSSIQEAYQI